MFHEAWHWVRSTAGGWGQFPSEGFVLDCSRVEIFSCEQSEQCSVVNFSSIAKGKVWLKKNAKHWVALVTSALYRLTGMESAKKPTTTRWPTPPPPHTHPTLLHSAVVSDFYPSFIRKEREWLYHDGVEWYTVLAHVHAFWSSVGLKCVVSFKCQASV
jgi:hypothetical protein